MRHYYGNILIQQESFRFPRTPFDANILARTFLLALGLGRDTRSGLVAGSVAPVSQLNHALNPCRDAATVKLPVPRVCVCAYAHARAHVATCLSRRRGVAALTPYLSMSLIRKNKRVVKSGDLPRHYPRRFLTKCRACGAVAVPICANLLIFNKIGGF